MKMNTFSWIPLKDLWPEFGPGKFARLYNDEDARFFALVLPDEDNAGGWRISLLFDHLHVGVRGFASEDEAKARAVNELSKGKHFHPPDDPLTWDSHFEEVLARLLCLLEDDWQIDHVTEYKREWIAVCRSNDGRTITDTAFIYDSFGVLGEREVLDLMAIFPLEV